MAPHMDFDRARRLARREQLDALLLYAPENFYYASSCSSMLAWLYREAPLRLALLPAGADVEPALLLPAPDVDQARRVSGVQDVHGIPVWYQPVVASDPAGVRELLAGAPPALPAQYDRAEICRQVARRLRARGLVRGRIGLDLDYVDAKTFAALGEANPEVAFVDATDLLYELRAIKSPAEVAALRLAAQVTSAGIQAAGRSISPASTTGSIAAAFAHGAWEVARQRGVAGHLGAMDGRPGFGFPGPVPAAGETLPPGATVKFDVQATVAHYLADLGRTYVLGGPTAEQARVWRILREAQQRARDALRPGVPLRAVYEVARQTLDRGGLRGVGRGHFGHGVGLEVKVEEPPFIAATSTQILEPGMVLSVEAPFFAQGIGAFQLEDMCLVTESGYEILNDLPYELQVVEP